MAMRFAHALGVLMLGAGCALFNGCASLRSANGLFAGTQDADTDITRYQGRFSAHYTQNNTERSAIGNFPWHEYGPGMQLELVSPLGQTLVVVSQSNQGATLELPNQLPCHASEVDTLMQDTLGLSLLVSGLRDRLRVHPMPGIPACMAYNAQPHPGTIEQNGWTVHYVVWTDDGNNIDGARVDIRRLGPDRPQGTDGPPLVQLVFDQ